MQSLESALHTWFEQSHDAMQFIIKPLAGDASFRRYFRLYTGEETKIIMDVSAEKELLEPFLNINGILARLGIHVPKVHALNREEGFVLLDDFGDGLLLEQLSSSTAHSLYLASLAIIKQMQNYKEISAKKLRVFDKEFMLQELHLFKDWFLKAYLGLDLTSSEENLLKNSFAFLIKEISRQPRVFTHRDYHSRNIMVLDSHSSSISLGIIDFQDAMWGPFTYDLVSLLKDCYIQWPRDQVLTWIEYFYHHSSLAQQWSFIEFIQAFDLCGLQRHLKVLGVFSRLYLRDNKPDYLQHLPLTLHYVLHCLENYEPMKEFHLFIKNRVQLS